MSTLRKSYSEASVASEEDDEEEEVDASDKEYSVWQYFTKIDDKEAKCNLCERVYNYSTNSTNLKSHLAMKHIEHFPDWEDLRIRRERLSVGTARSSKRSRLNQSYLWNYFEKLEDRRAECSFCQRVLSYKSTIHNLKMHLVRSHPRKVNLERREQHEAVGEHSQYPDANEEEITAEPPDQVPSDGSIARYFESEGDGLSRCSLCEAKTSDTRRRRHLSTRHPKVLAALVMQASEDEEEKPTMREITQDPLLTTPNENRRKRKTKCTSSDDDTPLVKQKEQDKPPDLFLQYLGTLLKDLSPDVYLQLQMDVINLVMKARINHEKLKGSREVATYQLIQLDPQLATVGSSNNSFAAGVLNVNSTVFEATREAAVDENGRAVKS